MDLQFVRHQPVLENAPLKLVICQMRFPQQIGLSEADVRPVQRALTGRYPEVQVGRTTELTLTPAGIASAGGTEPVFQFRSDDGGWTFTVGRDSASLETLAYVDFADFAGRWYEAITAVTDALDLSRQDRIGLRFVNELECNSPANADQLGKIVRLELVGVVGGHERTRQLVSSMQELRFAQERGVCALRHGLVTRGDQQSVYVLDMDFYDDEPQALDLEVQVRLLADFNHGAYDLFEWAIPPDHFATFAPRKERNG